MKRILILCCALSFIAVTSTFCVGQDCTGRGMKSVQRAKLQAISGDKEGAKQNIEAAESQCGTSAAVLRGISEVYSFLGDSVLANVYTQQAARFDPGAGANPSDRGRPGPSRALEAKSFVREKYALVVGIGTFQRNNIPTLKYAAKDATDFATMLRDPNVGRFQPQNVILLTDETATTTGIKTALAQIASKALEDDLVVLYFSTHGSSPSMDHSKIGAAYLIPYDTDVTSLYGTAYGMDELAQFMKEKLRAKRIVTFLDTCYSGDSTRHMRSDEGSKALTVDSISSQAIEQIAQATGSVVITSSTDQQLSWESDTDKNSFFTLYLLESMRKRKGLGSVSDLYTDLQRSVSPSVKDYTRKKGLGSNGKGADQDPAIYPKEIPDIVIGAPTH